jgi:lipopolysaccharide transport system ATP-binding protein
MNNTIIKVENISKEYNLGTISHGTLYRDLQSWSAKLRGKEDPNSKIGLDGYRFQEGSFKALDNVSFEVKQGDVLGIIGSNGAGKSTLLKIISQVTTPSSGAIKIKGRVASLLEVGTGFHPELTGRENIFLNGAILGMSKQEIRRKFDEIVDFADIEKFIDTPVKRYSSGMYVRLAFAVAAHLEPEILVLDEVLAVGDAQFQKKCLGKMGDISEKGRTVLFVSHNMQAVKNLCPQCILLDKGVKVIEEDTETVFLEYNKILRNSQLKTNKGEYNANRRGSGTLSFTNIEILDMNNEKRNIFNIGETVKFKMDYAILSEIKGLHVGVHLRLPRFDMSLTGVSYEVKKEVLHENEQGTVLVEFDLSTIRPGEYNLYFWLGDTKALTQGNPTNYDVADNVTEPLIVKASNEEEKKLGGCFSVLTRMKILQ